MSKPVLLVHGAWAGAWAWGYVQVELDALGVAHTAIDLPSRDSAPSTMADDAAAISAALDAIGQPAVVVGHSYSGIPVTQAAAANPNAAHIVYTCAAVAEVGQSTLDLMGTDPVASALGQAIRATDDGLSTLDPDGATATLFNDVSAEQAAPIVAALGTHRLSVFGEGPDALGYTDLPSTYILTTMDLVFSPELQRSMAVRAGAEVVEVEAGHIPQLSRARELAAAIAKAAQ